MRDEYEITDAIQILIDDGYRVNIAEVIRWDVNVSYPHDLLKCNLQELNRLGQMNIIGRNARIPPETEIINSVIGDNVIVENPIKIYNSLIFHDTVVSSKSDIEGFIITPDNKIDCKHLLSRG